MAIFLLFAQMQLLSFAQVSADVSFHRVPSAASWICPRIRISGWMEKLQFISRLPANCGELQKNMFVVPASLDETNYRQLHLKCNGPTLIVSGY
jgi:hypothetical protein